MLCLLPCAALPQTPQPPTTRTRHIAVPCRYALQPQRTLHFCRYAETRLRALAPTSHCSCRYAETTLRTRGAPASMLHTHRSPALLQDFLLNRTTAHARSCRCTQMSSRSRGHARRSTPALPTPAVCNTPSSALPCQKNTLIMSTAVPSRAAISTRTPRNHSCDERSCSPCDPQLLHKASTAGPALRNIAGPNSSEPPPPKPTSSCHANIAWKTALRDAPCTRRGSSSFTSYWNATTE